MSEQNVIIRTAQNNRKSVWTVPSHQVTDKEKATMLARFRGAI